MIDVQLMPGRKVSKIEEKNSGVVLPISSCSSSYVNHPGKKAGILLKHLMLYAGENSANFHDHKEFYLVHNT